VIRSRGIALAAMLAMAPLGARGADLVVWWEKGFNPEEDEAIREIVAAFEQETGNQVELTFHPQVEFAEVVVAALEADHPPDFAFGTLINDYIDEWAFEDRLVDLTKAVGHFSDLFDPDALRRVTLLNGKTRQKHSTPCLWVNFATTSMSGRAF
jgi:multiple sugar transport system substrate-binding protein